MASTVLSCTFEGIESVAVSIEADLSKGLPAFQIVGLPEQAVRESRERVHTVLKNRGWSLPLPKILVNLAPADLKIASAEPVTWGDGSLGCPEDGMMYTQVLVDGYLVTVQAGGQTYEYHTAGLRSWVRCENGRPASNGAVGG